jgi:hypothetical protein
MPYRVRGTVNDTCRVLLFNESDMSLERSGVFDAGDWELIANNTALKMVIVRASDDGEAFGYGGITPETYNEPDVLLAINTIGDWLAIDDLGNGLSVSPSQGV